MSILDLFLADVDGPGAASNDGPTVHIGGLETRLARVGVDDPAGDLGGSGDAAKIVAGGRRAAIVADDAGSWSAATGAIGELGRIDPGEAVGSAGTADVVAVVEHGSKAEEGGG